MAAGKYNFGLEQGATFSRVITWKDSSGALIDLTGMTGRMKIRNLSGGLILSLTQTANGNGSKLTLGGTAGTITVLITNTETDAMTFTQGKYDLELVAGDGSVTRLLEGLVSFDRQQTD